MSIRGWRLEGWVRVQLTLGVGCRERVCLGQRQSRFRGWKNISRFTVESGGGTEQGDPLRAVAKTRERGGWGGSDRLPKVDLLEGWLPAPS